MIFNTLLNATSYISARNPASDQP